jgi:hypothetical protein
VGKNATATDESRMGAKCSATGAGSVLSVIWNSYRAWCTSHKNVIIISSFFIVGCSVNELNREPSGKWHKVCRHSVPLRLPNYVKMILFHQRVAFLYTASKVGNTQSSFLCKFGKFFSFCWTYKEFSRHVTHVSHLIYIKSSHFDPQITLFRNAE